MVVGVIHSAGNGKSAMNRLWRSDYKAASLTAKVYKVYRRDSSMFIKLLYVAI